MTAARRNKRDEFYTRWDDIELEVMAYPDGTFRDKVVLLPCDDPEWSEFTRLFAAAFETLGLRGIIATSYNPGGRGKVFRLDRDADGDGRINLDDLSWEYLDGDGDFRSAEVTALRDEADVVVTNPPFSLFREFLAWIVEGDKQFLILGNVNAITYKDVFPLIKEGKIWFGPSIHSGDREFRVPDDYPLEAAGCRIGEDGRKYIRVKGVRWYTNLDHDKRHEPLHLATARDNELSGRHLKKTNGEYLRYDNYDAIECPTVKSIPSDHDGAMGVPITFLDKHCPEQFEIINLDSTDPEEWVGHGPAINEKHKYRRIFIRHRKQEEGEK